MHCHHVLKPIDLVPILSWATLKGKCRYCHEYISIQYPLVEAVTGLLFLGLFVTIGYYDPFGALELVLWFSSAILLISLFVYDLRWRLLPDRFTYPLAILALLVRLAQSVVDKDPGIIIESLLGAVVIAGLFSLIFYASNGKWIGGGDVKLALFIGLALGLLGGFIAVTIAAWAGSLVVLVISAKDGFKINKNRQIPFGPYLILGTYASYFFGDEIIDWYYSLLL